MDLKTPLYKVTKNVYEPSEDTFLFLDALSDQKEWILSLEPKFIIEIGSGSGVISAAIGDILKNKSFFLIATDINMEACECTMFNSKANDVKIEVVCSSLFENFRQQSCFDLILFNPPYVPSEREEIKGNGLNRAWAGGENGREIIDLFLNGLLGMLSEKGVCFMITVKENNLSNIKDVLFSLGFDMCVIKERKVQMEHLFVLKISRILKC